MNSLKIFFITAICLISTIDSYVYGHDFEVDGIQYNIISVTDPSVYVSGITEGYDVVIPENVTYNNCIFSVDSIGYLDESVKRETNSIRFSKKLNVDSRNLCGCRTSCFYVDSENPYMTAVDGVLYSKDMTLLISYPPSKRLKEFVIPNSVNKIGEMSFADNYYLEKLVFNDKIEDLPYLYIEIMKD